MGSKQAEGKTYVVDVLGEGASGAIQIEAETRGKTKNDKSEDSHLLSLGAWCTRVVEISKVLKGRHFEISASGRRGDRARSGSKQTLDKTSKDLAEGDVSWVVRW